MKTEFPQLPGFEFSWRSLQVEPVPYSGERITLAALIKGNDHALIAAKLIHVEKLKKIYGLQFGERIAEALSLCVREAEAFYGNKPLATNWTPPLEGFYLSNVGSSLAENIEEALFRTAMRSSSFWASFEMEKTTDLGKKSASVPEIWRRRIFEEVKASRADFSDFFERKVAIRGSGVPLVYSFLSTNYAAQFDALSEINRIQQVLVRAQSKLWQLDRLRDEGTLFKPGLCELLIQTPSISDDTTALSVREFIDELQYEASRRELSVYAAQTPVEAAKHLIEKAA